MPNVNYALSSKSKDQLRYLYNYFNQNVITAINTLDGSTLGHNLITSHQVDHMSSGFIPPEAVEKLKSKIRVKTYELRAQNHELRVHIHELGVQIYELRVQIHELRVQVNELRVKIHELRIQIQELRVQIYELQVQIHELEH